MRKSVLLFAGVAFALTGGTIYFVNSWMKQERSRLADRNKQTIAAESGVYVLVAARDLPAGHIVVVSDLRWQSWPDTAVPQQYIARKGAGNADIPANYVGTIVRRSIVASGPITGDNLIKLGDRGFLAAVLKPGTRAISVRVDETTGVAGLLYPGDRVDLILTHEVEVKSNGERTGQSKVRVSETILSNVRVIAIDQALEDLKASKDKKQTPKSATLEVTPRQAEIVTVARRMGTITLTLQSLACAGGESQTASAGDGPHCAAPANALPEDPERGRTYTADRDVSRVSTDGSGSNSQVFILRGTKARQEGVTVHEPPEAAGKKSSDVKAQDKPSTDNQ